AIFLFGIVVIVWFAPMDVNPMFAPARRVSVQTTEARALGSPRQTRTVTHQRTDLRCRARGGPVTENDHIALSVQNLYKVFGRRPKDAVRQLASGASRDEVAG